MPGSDEQYDLVRVKDQSSNSKADTFFVAPKHVGRDGVGTQRVVLEEVGEPPSPPAGNQYLFLATDGVLKAKFADGTVTPIGGEAGAPDDAEYVTLSANGDLTAEQLHQDLTGADLHDPAVHGGSHADGGSDALDVDDLIGGQLKADLTAPDGTVLSSQIPDLAVTETFTVADQAGRLALTDVQEGDVALQTDTDEGYIFTGGDPSLDANWSLLSKFDPPVDSVFGRVGDIVAQAGDYAASQISNFSSTVLSSIDGATITPAQTGTSSSPTDVEAATVNADSVDAGSVNAVQTTTESVAPPNAQSGILLEHVTIPDDEVVTFDVNGINIIFIFGNDNVGGVGCFAPLFNGINTFFKDNISNEGTAVLDGTTGTDGSLNIAVDTGSIYLENRTGQEKSYTIQIAGA